MKNIKRKICRINSTTRRAFTLVELLLVMTILAVLAGIVLPSMINRSKESYEVAAKADISNLGVALATFEVDNGYFPKGPNGLRALVLRPREAQITWKGPYLTKNTVPLDPWKHPYVYEYPGKHNPSSYDLYTKGKDGQGGANTIGNWSD